MSIDDRRVRTGFLIAAGLAAILAIVALASDGGVGNGSPEETADGFYKALSDRDGGRACDYLTPSMRDEVRYDSDPDAGTDSTCTEALTFPESDADLEDFANAEVSDVEEFEDSGTVVVDTPEQEYTLDLIKEGGGWRIDGFGQ